MLKATALKLRKIQKNCKQIFEGEKMQIRDEGENAFFKKINELINDKALYERDHLLCLKIKQRIKEGEEWEKVLLDFLDQLSSEEAATAISPDMEVIYHKLDKNRSELKKLNHDIEGSMTLLIIFD